ncbi:MAG: RDD family protein [Candidatus Bathyarchaeia archaeon]
MRVGKMSTGHSNSPQFDATNHWLLRFLALVVDSIILGIVAYVLVYFVIFPLLWGADWWILVGWGLWLWISLSLGILMILYYVVMEVSSGATLGKKVMGLQVQMVDGSRVTFDKAFIRNISKIFWLFLLLDWIMGFATPGSDPRQKYTDRIAGTTVVSLKQAPIFGGQPPPPPPPPA